MKDAQQAHHAADECGPENMLNQLIEFGYPWSVLGSCLKHISNELKTVAEGYVRKNKVDKWRELQLGL